MDFINKFVLYNEEEEEEEERQQKRRKKAYGAATDSKGVKSLKSVIRGKAVWVVKEVFGFEGNIDVSQQTYPRTWSDRYSRFVPKSINGIFSYRLDGFKTKNFLEVYQGGIQALAEILSFKQRRKYANVELLEYLILVED